MWTALKHSLHHAISDFFFPCYCLLCGIKIQGKYLCSLCFERIKVDSHSGKTKRDNVFFACDAIKETSFLCRESVSLPSVEELIASLLTIRLCSLNVPIADVIIPMQTQGLDATSLADRVARLLSSKASKAVKVHAFTCTDEGYLLKETVSLSKRATFLIKDVCFLSFFPMSPSLHDECYCLLSQSGVSSIYFLSFVSEGDV